MATVRPDAAARSPRSMAELQGATPPGLVRPLALAAAARRAGGLAPEPGQGGRSWAALVLAFFRPSLVRARLQRLRALGHVEQTPSLPQLLVAARDQMIVSATEETRIFYRSQGIPWIFHNVRRLLSGPATMLDPVGLFSPARDHRAPRAADVSPPPALRSRAPARPPRRRRGAGAPGGADPCRHASPPARADLADRGRLVPRPPAARDRRLPRRPLRARAPHPRRPGPRPPHDGGHGSVQGPGAATSATPPACRAGWGGALRAWLAVGFDETLGGAAADQAGPPRGRSRGARPRHRPAAPGPGRPALVRAQAWPRTGRLDHEAVLDPPHAQHVARVALGACRRPAAFAPRPPA